ncbi:MAG: hypothetical protein K2G63_04385 [Oscillospiraceae bacterium]|nr:hypothetical protein [Oscillospiraceae bacterium]
MNYIKINDNGAIKEIPLDEIETFCKCPECGKEVKTDLYELCGMVEETGEMPFDIAVWCDECHDEAQTYRRQLRHMSEAYSRMPLEKLREVYNIISPYFTPECYE